jgi:hypothetical protein
MDLNTKIHPKTENVMVTGRILWPSLLKPVTSKKFPAQGARFKCDIMIPKGADLAALKKQMGEVASEEWGSELPKKINKAFKKTSENDALADYADDFPNYLSTWSKDDRRPGVVDRALERVDDEAEIYSGRWAMISVRFWTSTTNGNSIGAGLRNVQLLDHDEPIGTAKARPEDEFYAVTDEFDAKPDSSAALFDE